MNVIHMGMSSSESENSQFKDYDQLRQAIGSRIEKIRGYVPKVGVFGDAGVGKSSLCNALFGKEVAKIADVEACTRSPQEILIQSGSGGGIALIDVPGVGEDPARQREYMALYESLAPNLDLILWVIKADSRSYASSLEAYSSVKKSAPSIPIVFVISQADKTNDSDDWEKDLFSPGGTQVGNIAIKELDVSKKFGVIATNIVSVATNNKKQKSYNIEKLVELVVNILPNEKKYSFTREAKDEFVSEQTIIAAEKGIVDIVKEMAGAAYDYIKDDLIKIVQAAAPVVIKKGWDFIKTKLRF